MVSISLALSINRSVALTSVIAVLIFSAVGVAADLLCCVRGDFSLYRCGLEC